MATGDKHEHVMHLGMNDNILFQGTTFHVQTEDSGINNPFVTTHVFIGGNILATKKTSYDDIVKSDSLPEIVRSIMDDQHKKVMVAIKRGKLDKNGPIKKSYTGDKPEGSSTQEPSTQESATPATQVTAPQETVTQIPSAETQPVTGSQPQIPPVKEEEPDKNKKESDSFDDLILKNLSLDKK